jgi:hypothetical protein
VEGGGRLGQAEDDPQGGDSGGEEHKRSKQQHTLDIATIPSKRKIVLGDGSEIFSDNILFLLCSVSFSGLAVASKG